MSWCLYNMIWHKYEYYCKPRHNIVKISLFMHQVLKNTLTITDNRMGQTKNFWQEVKSWWGFYQAWWTEPEWTHCVVVQTLPNWCSRLWIQWITLILVKGSTGYLTRCKIRLWKQAKLWMTKADKREKDDVE